MTQELKMTARSTADLRNNSERIERKDAKVQGRKEFEKE
jgi:hypothetical protein